MNVDDAATATADIITLVDRASAALDVISRREINTSGVFSDPTQVHRDLVVAADAVAAASTVMTSTPWPITRDYAVTARARIV